MGPRAVKLSVVIPAHNEEAVIEETVSGIVATLDAAGIRNEVLVIDDASTDRTRETVDGLSASLPSVRCLPSHNPPGFGFAVRAGLDHYSGDAVAIVMADGSDNPADLVSYTRVLEGGSDCAFGSRFMSGATVTGYPIVKRVINRVVNRIISILFRLHYNDTTNAFKAYRREVIESIQPLLSNHFNLTVEMPLKAVTRGHSFAVVPTGWRGRKVGVSSLSLQEMGSRYLYIVASVWLEHHLTRGDYRRDGYRPGNARRNLPRPDGNRATTRGNARG